MEAVAPNPQSLPCHRSTVDLCKYDQDHECDYSILGECPARTYCLEALFPSSERPLSDIFTQPQTKIPAHQH